MDILIESDGDGFVAEVEGRPTLRATGPTELDALKALVGLLRRLEEAEDVEDAALAREVLATDHERIPHDEVKRLLSL